MRTSIEKKAAGFGGVKTQRYARLTVVIALVGFLAMTSQNKVHAVWTTVNWSGATDTAWETATNWDGDPTTADEVWINTTTNIPVVLSSAVVVKRVNLMKSGGVATMRIVSGGNFESLGTTAVGWYGTGRLDQEGGTLYTHGNMNLGDEDAGDVGTYNLSGGTATIGASLALGVRGDGFVNVSGASTVLTVNGTLQIASWVQNMGATGTYTQNDGAVTIKGGGGNGVRIGGGAGCTGVLNLNGGTLDVWGQISDRVDGTYVGGTGTLNVNDGTLNMTYQGTIYADKLAYRGGTINNVDPIDGVQLRGTGDALVLRNTDANFRVNLIGASGGNVVFENDANAGGTISGRINLGGLARTFNVADAAAAANDLTVSGQITAGGVTKTGLGALVLSNSTNDYAGGTTVDAGTLLVNNTSGSGTGTGTVTLNSLGTLGGSGSISGLVTGSGTLAPGNSAGTLTLTGGLTTTDGIYDWQLDSLVDSTSGTAGTDWDLIDLANSGLNATNPTVHIANLAPSNDAFWQSAHEWTIIANIDIASSSFSGTTSVTGYDVGLGTFGFAPSGNNLVLSWAPVPEPGTLALLATGLLGLLAYAWRKWK